MSSSKTNLQHEKGELQKHMQREEGIKPAQNLKSAPFQNTVDGSI